MASNKSKRPRPLTSTPQNISKIKGQWGGRRVHSGGSRQGSGRPQRVPCEWPENVNLKTSIGVDKFLRQVIEDAWKENVLDARTLSALNSTIKLLLDLRGWINPGPNTGISDDPVEDDNEEDDQKSEVALEPDRKAVAEAVNSTITHLTDQVRQELEGYMANTQALIDDPTTPPELKEKSRQLLERIHKKLGQSV